jgi:YD repeat-containing protein
VPAQGEVGQSGYVAPSGAETTYYVYNANNQLVYTIDPLGAVTEHDYTTVNGLSELTTTRQYLGATYSASSNSTSNPPTLSQLQAWAQSSAVQSTLSQSTRTDYTYDIRGQLATQTQYDTVDANGNGVLTNGMVTTTTTYDVQGKLLHTSTETGTNRSTLQTTTYAYDGLGRMISKTDPMGNVTTYVYTDNGSNDTLVITQANGLIITQVRNSAGLLVSSTQSTAGTSGGSGSGSGINNQANITVKDAQGRVVGQIAYQEGPGFVMENMLTLTSYDSQGNVSEGILYMSALTNQQIASLGSNPTLAQLQALATPGPNDQVYLVVKDDQGRIVAQIGSLFSYSFPGADSNNLTTTTYNSAGEVSSTTHYAASLTSSQVLSLGNNPTVAQLEALASSGSALTTYSVYDNQGRVVAMLAGQTDTVTNADGSTQQVVDYVVTTTSHGGAGGVNGTIRYATPLTQAQVDSLGSDPTLAQVQALLTPSNNDQANLKIEDAQGHVIGQIQYQEGPGFVLENMLTLTSYDSQGNVSEGILYVSPLTGQQIASLGSNPTLAQLQALATPGPNDQVYLVVQDDQGRIVAQIGSLYGYSFPGADSNNLTTTTYNSAGEISSTTHYAASLTSSQVLSLGSNPTVAQLQAQASSGSALTTYSVYDSQGRVVAMLAGQTDTVTNADGSTQQVVDYVVTTTSYGGAGGVNGTIRYATPLTQAQVDSLGSDPTLAQVQALLTPSNNDQANLKIEDAQGHVIGQIQYQEGPGFVLENMLILTSYDSQGNVSEGILYVSPLTGQQIASLGSNPTLAQLQALATPGPNDQVYLVVKDDQGRIVAQIGSLFSYSFPGADSNNLTTTTYNSAGEVSSTTHYAASLTSSQVLSLGNNPTVAQLEALASSGSALMMYYVYDDQGRVVAQAAGQLDTVFNADGSTQQVVDYYLTTTSYASNGSVSSTIRYGTPLTQAQVASLANDPTLAQVQVTVNALGGGTGEGASTSVAGRTTTYLYDADGELIATIDPNGNASYTFYDADGRISGTVDNDGHVIAYAYDADGQLIRTTQYATPVSTSGWLSNGALTSSYPPSLPIPASSSSDVVTARIYDAAGNIVATFDSAGHVTTTSYNGDGNVVATTEFATSLATSQLASLGSAPSLAALMAAVTPNVNDRTTLTIYDVDQQATAIIDPAGTVKVMRYDLAGDVIGSTVYPTPLTAAQIQQLRSSQNVSTLQLLVGAMAQTIYNAANQPVATISAAGLVTVTNYDSAGNATEIIHYATPLTSAQLSALGIGPSLADVMANVTTSAYDITTLAIYDGNHHAVATVNAQGQVTENTYDAAGNVTASTVFANTLTAAQVASLGTTPTLASLQALITPSSSDQTTYTVYDGNERVVATITPAGVVTIVSTSPAGDVAITTQYATALTAQQIASFASSPSLNTLQGEVSSSANDQISLAFYNGSQQEVAAVSATGKVTLSSFDGAGNLVSRITETAPLTSAQLTALQQSPSLALLYTDLATNSSAVTALTIYGASNRSVATVSSNGVVAITVYDASGNTAETIQYANALTAQQVDALGTSPSLAALQALLVPSNSDVVTLTIRDPNGRTIAAVSGGMVVTTTYDSYGNVAATVQYANALTSQQIESLGAAPTLANLQTLLVPSNNDNVNVTIYDASHRALASVGSNRAVATTTYDASGNVVATTSYATALTVSQAEALAGSPSMATLQSLVTSSENDRITLTIRDVQERPVATVNYGMFWYPSRGQWWLAGQVITTTYDAAGNVSTTMTSGNLLTWDQMTSLGNTPTLAQLQALLPPSADDDTIITIRDSQERAVATLEITDGYLDSSTNTLVFDGLVTTTTYNTAGQVVASTRYRWPITQDQINQLGSSPTLSQLQADVTPSQYDQTTLTVYNDSGQVEASILPANNVYDSATGLTGSGGVVTINSYNSAGGLIETVRYANLLTATQMQQLGATPTLAQVQAMLTPSSNDEVQALNIYDANNTLVAQVQNGFVTAYTYNQAGQVLSSTFYYPSPSSAQLLALAGNPTPAELQSVLASSSTGQRTTYNYYDANGHLIGQLLPYQYKYNDYWGAWDDYTTLVTYGYDAQGRQVWTDTYYRQLTAGQVNGLGSNPTLSALEGLAGTTNADTVSITLYDAQGRIAATVVNNGAISITAYDSQGRVVDVTNYFARLTIWQQQNLMSNPTLDNLMSMVYATSGDTGTVTVYGSGGGIASQLTVSNPGAGPNTANLVVYDANGNVVSNTQYTRAPSMADLAALGTSPTLAQLQALITPSSSDVSTVTLRNANGQVIGTVDNTGQVTITTYDAAGNPTLVRTYAKHLTALQVDQLVENLTLANLSAMVSPERSDLLTVTVYDASGRAIGQASSNGGVNLMSYDASGNLLATQHYAVNLTFDQLQALTDTPSLAALQLDLYADQGNGVVQNFYNAAGQVIAAIDASGNVTVNTYDAAGKLTAMTLYANPVDRTRVGISTYAQLMEWIVPSGSDQTTRTIYNANEQPVATISASGQVTLIAYDANGNPVSSTLYSTPLTAAQMHDLGNAPSLATLLQMVEPSTRAIYNAAGEQIAAIDQEGNASYSFYNAAGQLAATVNADGDVTTYSYDADGHLTQTAAFATPISTTGWLNQDGTLASAYPGSLTLPASSSTDRITTRIYDSEGKVVASIDPSGDVTVVTYDAFGEPVTRTQYANPLTAAQVQSLGTAPTLSALQALIASSADDRITTAQYDQDGREVLSVDAAGYVTQTTYDANGNVILQSREISAGVYAITRSYYDGLDRLVAQVDADGYLTIYSYDTASDTKTSTRYASALTSAQLGALTGAESTSQLIGLLGSGVASEQTSDTYNADGQVTSSTAADGTVTSYQYDTDGRLIGTLITPANGQGAVRTTSTAYDANGNIVSFTDANGDVTTYVYNLNNQRIESTDAEGNTTWYYYDPAGRLTYTVEGQPQDGVSNQWGNVTAYSYDAFGDVTSTTVYASQLQLDTYDPSYGGLINPSESSAADIAAAIGALAASSSDANATTTVSYTNNGQVASIIDGDGYQTGYTYDAFGDRVQVQRQLSQAGQPLSADNSTTTVYTYDANGEQASETDAEGTAIQRTTSTTYDGLGDVVSATDGVGNTTTYQYDALGQRLSNSLTVQGVTRTTTTHYDAFGRVLSTTDALGHITTYSYNLATHTIVVTTPDGVTMTTVKDAYGDTVSVTDGAGNTTSYTYDADGHLLSTTDALGNTSTNQYDGNGNLILTSDATGYIVTYTYDADGRMLSKIVDPHGLSLETDYVYDGEGRKVTVRDPVGAVTAYTYDADGNVLAVVVDPGTNGLSLSTTTYTYDGAGNTLTVTQGAGSSVATTTQYVYDALGRETAKIIDPNGLALITTYQYDANDNLTAVTDPYGNVTYTVYNEANEAIYTIASANGPNSGSYTVKGYTYDADGRLTSTSFCNRFLPANGETLPPLNAMVVRANSTTTIVDNIVHTVSTADATYFQFSYNVYNADGQLIYQIDRNSMVTEFRYNALGQLSQTLGYPNIIVVSTALAQSMQDGTVAISDIQSALAQNGNTDGSARVTYAYYDADGRLAYNVLLNQVDGVLSAVVSQKTYDAAGRTVADIQYGVALPLADVGAGATSASIAQALAQTNTAATTRTTRYFYDNAGRQVAQIDPSGNTSYTFYDAAGRVAATVSATGAVVQYSRDDLGRVIQQTSYATPVQTAGWLQSGQVTVTLARALPPSDGSVDRVTYTSYDAVGRVGTVSTHADQYGNGNIITYSYDNDSRVVEADDVDLSNNSAERITRYYYGTKDNTVATLNADGTLSLSYYDGAGHLLQTTVYATQVPTWDVQQGETLAQLMPATSVQDETTSYYYDAHGNRVAMLDAKGYLTYYGYDNDGRQVVVTRYADALDAASVATYRYSPGSTYPDIFSAPFDRSGPSQSSYQFYDAYGDVIGAEDANGFFASYSYDSAGNLVHTESMVDHAGDYRITSNAYDAFGNLISSTDGVGNVTTYIYDLNGNRTSKTDALGNTTWYVYDQDNRMVYTLTGMADSAGNQNALAEVSETDYDTFGDVTSSIKYTGLVTVGAGFPPSMSNMSAVLSTLSSSGSSAVDYRYDLEGHVITKYDGNGVETDYTYDGYGDLVSRNIGGIDGLMTVYSYDQMGNLIDQMDEQFVASSGGGYNFAPVAMMRGSGYWNGSWQSIREQQWTYDAFGNVSSYIDGDYKTTNYTHDGLNQQTSASQSVSGQTRQTTDTCDAYGRLVTSTDAQGLVTSYTYDDVADSVTRTEPDGVTTTTVYNAQRQVMSVTDGQGNTTRYNYDADGRLIQTTNPDGSVITRQYDAVGNLVQTTDADGNVAAYTYDAAGNVLTKTVDPNGLKLVTSYTYDGRGFKTSETDPNGVVTTYSYDGNGNVRESVQDANGVDVITYSYYNYLNEVTSSSERKLVNGIWQAGYDYYNYDVLGRLTSETTDTGHATQTAYAYDGDGNVVSKTDGNGNTTYYSYNEADQLVYTVAPNGAVTYTTYNLDGQVTATTHYATELSANAIWQVATYGSYMLSSLVSTSSTDRTTYNVYNSGGQLEYTIDPNGNVTQTIYNSLGQVAQTLAYATPVQLSSSAINDLQAGNASAEADVQAALSAAGNNSSTAHITYTFYDDMGRVSSSFSSATLNGQSGYLAQQTEYDANGNVIAQIQYGDLVPASELSGTPTTATLSSYLAGLADMHVTRSVYDAAGREVYSVDAAGYVTEMQYDKDGRVLQKIQYANAIGTPTAWTQTSVAAAIQAVDGNGAQDRRTNYQYDGVGNLVYEKDSNGNVTTFTYDERGLRLSSTDGSGHTTTYSYDQYGNLIQQTSPPVAVASYSGTGAYQGTTTASIVTTYQYDNNGNLITETDASGTSQARTTYYQYDAANNLIQTTKADPGAINAQTGLVAATGNTPSIGIRYNAFGEAIASQDANGNLAYNVYDNNGNLVYAIDGDGYVTGYTYNAYGQQTSVTRYATGIDTAGQGLSLSQPPSLAQIQAAIITSSADRTIATTYDAQGNKLTVTEPQITYTNSDGSTAQGSPVMQYTYDAYGNLTSQSVLVQGAPGSSSAVWATTYNYYDVKGRELLSVDPMGYVTTHAYDAFGDVLSITQWATAISTTGLTAGGAMPANPLPGDASTTGLDRIATYTYDLDGNKTGQSVQRSYTNAQGQAVVGWDTTAYGYDGDNRLTTVTENGNTITTAYDALGRVSSVTGPQVEVLVSNWQSLLEANPSLTLASPSLYVLASQVVSFSYDALGNKLAQTQSSTASAQTVSTYYQYDNAGNAIAQVTPLDGSGPNWTSSQARFKAYDANGNLVKQWYTLDGVDNSTATVTTINTYDGDNQQASSVTYRAGIPSPDKSTSTTYDAFGEVIASGDGVTNNVVTTYDNAGNKLTSTDPKTGELHTYGYNLAGQLVSDTVPLAASVGGTAQTLYTLDRDGRITSEQAPSTNAAAGENAGTLTATYDAWGNVLSSTDANGNTTTYTYNERNNVVTETEASVAVVGVDGTSTTTTPVKTSAYDIEGNVVASTDENGNVIKNTYNALGQKTESVDGAGNTLYTAYDALGNSVAQQDGNGNITFSNVDALGRTVQSGEFELFSDGSSRQAVWQQAYVLDQNGDRIISYDGIGSAYLQSGDTTNAALHANYDGYNSQGKVIWSQDAAQRAASTINAHGLGNYGTGSWTQTPPNADFSQGSTGWDASPGWVFGNWTYDGQNWTAQFNPSNLSNGGKGTLVSTDRVPVVPGQVITASGNTEVQSTNGWGSMEIVWYDAQGNVISTSTDKNSPGAEQDGRRGAGTAWVTGTAPAGATFAAIGVNAGNYNEGDPGVTFSRVWWDYTPPAYITSLGSGNGGAVVTLPSGSFTDQVTNGDFEEGNVGWTLGTGFSIDQSTSTANGNWQARYTGSGVASMVNNDRVPVVEGQSITASVQIALYLPDGASNTSGTVGINWYDANGNLISTSSGNTVYTDKRAAWKTSTVSASAPAGAAYAALVVLANNNGVGIVGIDAARWNYQYIPQVPTGVVQDTFVYDMDGNLVSETTADGDTESSQYNQYGQVTQHTDLSGAQYSYTYDANTGAQIGESDNWSPAAQGQVVPAYVTAPTTTPNSETLTYYADGQIATETFSDGSSYSYQYDNNGNLIREEDSTVDGNGKTVHTITQTTYDSHNRISHVVETDAVTNATMLDETFSYDAAGNRREVKATSNGTTQDAWYTYDGANRVQIADGSLQNGQIVVTNSTGSYENAYDANGNVIKIFTRNSAGDLMAQTQRYNALNQLIEADYAVDVTTGASGNGVQKTITYDANGHALVTQTFYETGATIQSNNQTVTVSGELESATVNFYDAVGRLAESQTFNTPSGWDGTASPIPTGTPSPDATTYGSLTLQSEVVYQGPNATSGYDADGNVVAYQYRDGTGRVDQYQLNYLKKDTYLQSDTTGDSNTANVQPATDQSIYNTRGNEVAMEQHSEDPYGNIADTVHVFAYNGAGEIIEREDGTGSSGSSLNLGSTPAKEVQHYTYVSGQQLAHFDDAGTLDVLDQVTAFSSNNDSPNSYVVQSGDTLESIAQTEYGNSNLWYVLAQANDLSSDTNLALGQRLQIPAVTTHANSAMTFKPYDPSSIIGSTTPNLPTIAPPPPAMHNNCSWLAQLVSFAVTAVVSWYAGPEAGMPAGNAAGQAAQAMLNGTFDWNRFIGHQLNPFSGNDSGMGKTVLSLLTIPTVSEVGFWTSKSGGSDFDIAVWNPLEAGMKGQFDRQSTLIAAGEGAATWGAGELGGAIGGAEDLSVDETKLLAGGLQGGAGYATNAGLNAAFGRPANFSLGGLVGSFAGGVAGAEVGVLAPGTGPVTGILSSMLQNAVGGTVDRELSVALGDTNVPTWSQIAMQSVGSGLGTGVIGAAGAINAYESQQAQTQQANQQLANNVVSQVTADQGMWNDTIWNGASAQEGAQLQSEGLAALNAAYQQAQANMDDGLYQGLQNATANINGVGANGAAIASSGQTGTGDGIAYSGMPLAGHGGAYIDYFEAPADSLVGTVPASSDALQGLRINVNRSTTSAGDSATTISASMSQSDGSTASESLGYGTTGGNWYLNLAVGSTSLNISASGISLSTTPMIGTTPTMSAAQYQAIMASDGPSPTSINGDLYLSSSVTLSQAGVTLQPIDLGDVVGPETITPGALTVQAASIPSVDIAVAQISLPAQQAPFIPSLYSAMANQYRQGEQLQNQVGQWISGKEQQGEQFLDQLRSNITAYGDGQGIVASVAGRNVADAIGITEGAAIGAYKMGAGLVSLANGAGHLTSAYSWAMDPQGNIQRVKTVVGTVAALNTFSEAVQTNPLLAWALAKPVVRAATADYRGYLVQRDYSKFFGRAGFDLATIAAGVIGGAGKLGEGAEYVNAFERTESVAGSNNVIVKGEGAYKDLVGKLDGGFQAHHLNQNAAFSSVIPKGEGFSIGIRGNAFTDVGTPHYDFHRSLEGFWDQYRVGGSSFGEVPTNAQYGDAVTQALQDAGLSPSEAQRLSDLAAQNRAAYNLSPNDPVPNIPRKIYQSGGN